jgi:hypothetical protein
MKRWYVSVLLTLVAAVLCCAQDDTPQTTLPNPLAPAQSDTSSADIKGSFPIMLAKGLDSKKMKEGDVVVCQTVAALHSRSGLLIPSGSKVIGHITQATARSKGSPDSTLAMMFDKIEIAKGKELPMKGTLQAVGPSLGDDSPNSGGPSTPVLMGGHSASGGSSAGTTPPPQATNTMNAPTSRPILLATSQGVLGVKNLQMDANGVLSSPGKEVRLDSGAQLLIRAEISTPVQ